jgi:hypothetical protein
MKASQITDYFHFIKASKHCLVNIEQRYTKHTLDITYCSTKLMGLNETATLILTRSDDIK